MTTTESKPTLESLGLAATVSACGVRSMNDDSDPMCAWISTFTNRHGHSENFDYFTGYGCGAKWPDRASVSFLLAPDEHSVLSMHPGKRHLLKDKAILCRIAHKVNFRAKWKPDPIEILWAIARDGDALELAFDDWCSELGYDCDSRRAEKIYRACQDNALRLRKLLSRDKINSLRELEM